MKIENRAIGALTAMALSACGAPADPSQATANSSEPQTRQTPVATTVAPSPAAAPSVAVDGEGLRLVDPATGRARPVAFGSPRAMTLAALASLGKPETGTNADCGAGPVATARYPGGLALLFQDDALAGWALDSRTRGISTMSGIAPGATRAALDAAYAATVDESSIGTEFSAGAIGGVLDGTTPAAKITDMWAGVTCIAR